MYLHYTHLNKHSTNMIDNLNFQPTALCFATFILALATGQQYGSYDDLQGWCKISETCCNGKRQSPIDLTFDYPQQYTLVNPFVFTGYEKMPTAVKLTNNHVQVLGEFTGIAPQMKVSGGDFNATYQFSYFRFAWGKDSSEGSEHSRNGVFGPLEVHYFHYNSKFANVNAAAKSSEEDALMVISVIFQLGEENPTLKKITDKLENVTYAGDTTDAEAFAPKDLFPTSIDRFFKYYGSNTVPPCKEIVLRAIFAETPQVSFNQMKKFRTLYQTAKGVEPKVPITRCFRPTQPLNGRTIEHDQQKSDSHKII